MATEGGILQEFLWSLDWFKDNQEKIDCMSKQGQFGGIFDGCTEKYDPNKEDKEENPSNENESNSEDKSSNFMNKNYSQKIASIMPEVRKEFYKNVDKGSKILSKNPVEMTKEEMMKAKAFVYDNAYHPKKDALNQHLENYFKVRYPGEAEYDATGRMIDPQSVIPEPTVTAKYKDINGRLIDEGLDNILIKTALSSKSGNGAKNLQKAVNSLQGFNVLKEDNNLGKKTATAVFDAIREHGADKLARAFDLTNKDNDDKFDLRYI
ncbi:MAG: hypothetical protein AB7U85_06795 [Alphaproteobacteria bacterium]